MCPHWWWGEGLAVGSHGSLERLIILQFLCFCLFQNCFAHSSGVFCFVLFLLPMKTWKMFGIYVWTSGEQSFFFFICSNTASFLTCLVHVCCNSADLLLVFEEPAHMYFWTSAHHLFVWEAPLSGKHLCSLAYSSFSRQVLVEVLGFFGILSCALLKHALFSSACYLVTLCLL